MTSNYNTLLGNEVHGLMLLCLLCDGVYNLLESWMSECLEVAARWNGVARYRKRNGVFCPTAAGDLTQ
jgi:hypothetical protein